MKVFGEFAVFVLAKMELVGKARIDDASLDRAFAGRFIIVKLFGSSLCVQDQIFPHLLQLFGCRHRGRPSLRTTSRPPTRTCFCFWTDPWPAPWSQPVNINYAERAIGVSVKIDASFETERIRLQVTAQFRTVVAKSVVMEP